MFRTTNAPPFGVLSAAGASVLRLANNLGYGGAVQTGLRYAYRQGFDLAVQMDADGQHDPGDTRQKAGERGALRIIRDDKPALYYYTQRFTVPAKAVGGTGAPMEFESLQLVLLVRPTGIFGTREIWDALPRFLRRRGAGRAP